ncbi:MAG TPA: sigma-54 dependent transcriptional regulator [Burkholderiales bacterium]|nr:sigma-54 dependent transcriptional regulator [Burkholderiales bacterium]
MIRKREGARHVLIVDDEPDILELLELALLRMGLEASRAKSVKGAMDLLSKHHFDLCLTDMRLPDGEGLALVEHIAKNYPSLPIAVITAHGSLDNAIAALKAGAFDYLAKPVSLDQLRSLIKSALTLPKSASTESGGLLGNSPAMIQVREMIDKLARSQAPVYIRGESGSGKELAARLIHEKSARREKPFVAVNCGAIPENLMESEFFGYRKGAFTGAEQDQEGFFQAADGGTLFLDEVADLPLLMQVKLLRAIQEKKVRRLGSSQEEPVNVRIISATHQSLAECVEKGRLRHDLYYRLNVIALRMPPLREMREDIPLLAKAILKRINSDMGHCEISAEALHALSQYDFPGNVRELENILERAAALCSDNLITFEDLQLEPKEGTDALPDGELPLPDYLDKVEKEAILDALGKTRFNRTAAAKLLGVTFRALRYRMERLGIK